MRLWSKYQWWQAFPARQHLSMASAALVARTSLGPIYNGTSFGSDDHRKWWFGIGRIFLNNSPIYFCFSLQ
jgi:hypothetical protein